MKFDEFCAAIGYARTQSTEIGKLFNKQPQVVNNWRLRDKVPAEYVLEALDKGLMKRKAS